MDSPQAFGRGDPLAILVALNTTKTLVQRVGKKGFLNKRTGVEYEGVTRVISERFPRVSKAAFRKGLDKRAPPPTAKVSASNPKLGTAFHAAALHSMVCLVIGRGCVCPTGSDAVTVTPQVAHMVRAAMKLFQDLKLTALCGELIIHSNTWRLGARCDMIAARSEHPTELVLVSWKTSGACPFPAGQVIAEFGGVLLSAQENRVQSTQDYLAQSHLAQLACELNMLWNTHAVYNIRHAVIIYVFPDPTIAPRPVWLGANSCKQLACETVVNVLASKAHLLSAR